MKRVLIYIFSDPDGIADKYVEYYLQGLKTLVSRIVVVCDGPINEDAKNLFEEKQVELIIQDNTGSNRMAWKTGLEHVGWNELKEYDELVLANDTAFGPIFPFEEMFETMSSCKDIDFWGVTSSCAVNDDDLVPFSDEGLAKPYIQDYFIVFSKTIVESNNFKKYWNSVSEVDRSSMTRYFGNLDYQWNVYARVNQKETIDVCDMYYRPDILLEKYRLPLLERKVFEYNTLDLSDGINLKKALRIIENDTDFNVSLIWQNVTRRCHQYDFTKAAGHYFVLPSDIAVNKADRNKEIKVALFMHLYFPDMFEEAYEHALKMPEDADVFITTNEQSKADQIKNIFSKIINRTKVILIENRGRSESALLVGMADFVPNYDIACFWKEKKSEHAGIYGGEAWANRINDSLFSSKEYVENIIDLFSLNPNLGLLSPPPPNHAHYFRLLSTEWGLNYENVKALADLLTLNVPISEDDPPIAPFGGALWFRTKAFMKLYNHAWRYEDFPKEPLTEFDGTLLHTIERVWPFVCQDAGYYPAYVLSDKYADNELMNLSFYIREYNKTIPKQYYKERSCIECTSFVKQKIYELDMALMEKAAFKAELDEIHMSKTWRYGRAMARVVRKIFPSNSKIGKNDW